MRVALRFALAYLALTALMYVWGDAYSRLWLRPLEIATAAAGSGTLIVDQIETARLGGQRVFRLQARTAAEVRTAQYTAPAGIRGQATTLQANAHHQAILVLAVLVAWPAPSRRRALLIVAGAPAIIGATLIDIPFALTGAWRDALLAAVDPQALRTDPGALYFQFLQRGGRPVLSLCAALLVIALARPRRTSDAAEPPSSATDCMTDERDARAAAVQHSALL